MKKSALFIVFLFAVMVARAQAGFGVLYDQSAGFEGRQILAEQNQYHLLATRNSEGNTLTRLELETGLNGVLWSTNVRSYPLLPNTQMAIGRFGDYWLATTQHTGPQETSLFLFGKTAAGLTTTQITYVMPDVMDIQIDHLVWQESSGDIFLAGCFRRFDEPKGAKPFLIKASISGTIVWDKLFNTAGKTFRVNHLTALADGGCAWVHTVNGTDCYLEKFSATGQSLWRPTIGGPLSTVTVLTETADQSIVVGLYNSSIPTVGGKTGMLLRFAADGSAVWEINLNTVLQANAVLPQVIAVTSNKDVVVAGNVVAQPGYPEKTFAVRLNPAGTMLWRKSFGFFTEPPVWTFATETPAYGFVFTGSSQDKVFLLVTDNLGNAGSANYCTAVSNNPWSEWISDVHIGTIDNSSGKSTYSDFTQLGTSGQEAEIPYAVTVAYSWQTYDEYLRIWVDLNQDEMFDNAEELVVSAKIDRPTNGMLMAYATGTFTLPGNKKLGNARMRVIVERGAWPDPCGIIPFGEVEDYSMNFNDAIPFHYCPSAASFPWHEWIAGVQLADVSNASGASSYTDYTLHAPISLSQGQAAPIALTTGYSWETFDENWSVWIDFNHNGQFDTPEELVFQKQLPRPANGTTAALLTGVVKVPKDAQTGLTRMRVSMQRDQYADPCSMFVYGEVEDYAVNISLAGPLSTAESPASIVKIYPNPFSSTVTIESESPVLAVRVYRLDGQLMAETGAVSALDLGQLATGIYLMEVQTERGTVAQKVVRADLK
jgi:hypothetical protein